jgi:hypothetical protein
LVIFIKKAERASIRTIRSAFFKQTNKQTNKQTKKKNN